MSAIPFFLSLLLLAQPEPNEASLKALQDRAATTKLTVVGNEKSKIEFLKAPVFRYSDEVRHIEDAGLWLWTDRGHPTAALKAERYSEGVHPRPLLYCFTSLSSGLITAEWPNERTYRARKPGIEWKSLEEQPAATRAARLVQLRDIARRFSAEVIDFQNKSRQMRLLSRPLFRFDEATKADGALFGFTGTGTNPDMLLLIETTDSGWRYGCTTMTAEGLRVRLNDKLVWEVPHTSGKGSEFDNWMYFLPKN